MPRIDRQKLETFKTYGPESTGVPGLEPHQNGPPADEVVSEITFFVDGVGGAKPFQSATPSPVQDVGRIPQLIEPPTEAERAAGFDADAFARRLTDTLAAKGAYFRPAFGALEGAHTRFKFNNIVGQRITQLITEAKALADALYPRNMDERDAAYAAANACAYELLSRDLQLKGGGGEESTTYAHDAAVIQAWENRLDELHQVDVDGLTPDEAAAHDREMQQIRTELDAIFRDTLLYDNAGMVETNAEESVGMCLIDARTEQRVSETLASAESLVPTFELLEVGADGERRAVYFDREEGRYYFDRSDEVVPDALVPTIQRRLLSETEAALLTFRRPIGAERLRKNFRYDWSGDGYVQSSVIERVGWAGHFHDKANLDAKGLLVPRAAGGLFEYGALGGGTAKYDPGLLDEARLGPTRRDGVRPAKAPGTPEGRRSERLKVLEAALSAADLFTAETELGVGLWTGTTQQLDAVTVRKDSDGRWALVSFEAGARPGVGSRSYLVRLGDDGRPADSVLLEPAASRDTEPRPERPKLERATAYEPALATAAGGRLTPEPIANLLEIICSAFDSRPHVLMHEGVRYFFETKEAFEVEKRRLEQLRAAIYGGSPNAPAVMGEIFSETGRVARGENRQLEVAALADGPLTFKLETKEGDADLFVKLGGPATNEDYTKKADSRGLAPDEVTLEARAGDRVHVAVYAVFQDSEYTLEVSGPRPKATLSVSSSAR